MRDVVVLDSGTHSTKAGFSGESVPRLITPTVVGHSLDEGEFIRYVGGEALQRRSRVSMVHPIKRGRICCWEDVEQVWQQTLEGELKVNPELHPVLLTEPTEEPVRHRERKAEIFFETLNVPQFSLATQSVLALHAEGYTSGVVVDIGAGHAAVVPVLEGKLIPYALEPILWTGEDLTRRLLLSLRKHGFREHLHTHWDIANHIKETQCSVNPEPGEGHYTLPDQTQITLSPSQRSLPTTLLHGPNSVQKSFSRSMSRLGDGLQVELCRHLVLAGGTTDCPGFREHMLCALGSTVGLEGSTRAESGRFRSWVGGSVLASLSSFSRISVLRSEYLEAGAGLINRRCRMEDGSDDFYGLYGFSGS